MYNRTKQVASSVVYYLRIGLPFLAAAVGATVLGLSAEIIRVSNHGRFRWTDLGLWNVEKQDYDITRVKLLDTPMPGLYSIRGFIAMMTAGVLCLLIGTAVGVLMFRNRYSLLKLRLADSQKYHWVLPTCIGLDVAALIVSVVVAIYAGHTEGFDVGTAVYQFYPRNLWHVGVTPDVAPNEFIYTPHNSLSTHEITYSPTRWFCNVERWTRGPPARHNQFAAWCGESRATLWVAITLAVIQVFVLFVHVLAWVSLRNKSPLFVEDNNETRERSQEVD